VRVRRSGRDLIVTWRTAFPARAITFAVAALGPRDSVAGERELGGRGRRAFRVRLRVTGTVRRVDVVAYTFGGHSKRTTVRVR
jgi:hypothetical protein